MKRWCLLPGRCSTQTTSFPLAYLSSPFSVSLALTRVPPPDGDRILSRWSLYAYCQQYVTVYCWILFKATLLGNNDAEMLKKQDKQQGCVEVMRYIHTALHRDTDHLNLILGKCLVRSSLRRLCAARSYLLGWRHQPRRTSAPFDARLQHHILIVLMLISFADVFEHQSTIVDVNFRKHTTCIIRKTTSQHAVIYLMTSGIIRFVRC